MRLARAEEMRALDGRAIEEYGIPGVVLMENAGQATVRAMEEAFGPLAGRRAAIFVGPGNNGGDGLVIARGLHQLGARVRVLLLVAPEKIRGDAAVNWRIVQRLPIGVEQVADEEAVAVLSGELSHCAVLVDALFGTGLKRDLDGRFAAAARLMSTLGPPVVAVDIPSGIDSDNGRILGGAVRADLTVTYGLAKPGHYCGPGRECRGRLRVVDIGIPPEAVRAAELSIRVITSEAVAAMLPERPRESHKGTYGHLLVAAGAPGKTGAALLAARGALRAGAGLVSCAVPGELLTIFETALAEAMTIPLPGGRFLESGDEETILAALEGKRALVLGPGIGTSGGTRRLAARLYQRVAQPMVVDADGLNCLAREGGAAAPEGRVRILTPHPGEMARLAGLATAAVQADRLACARRFAEEQGVYLVLKGASTVVAAPDGRLAINPTGNPGMAAGGMGDVLSGIIGALLVQGLGPWEAACAGVFCHGRAADRIARRLEIRAGFSASEVADEIPLVMAGV